MTQTCNRINCKDTVKFLYSYNGRIIPRPSDGCLRYVGGYTRILAVDRSITIAELMVKFGELCGSSMSLKCKLPDEDLDLLVSIKSDDDLRNVIGDYDRVAALTHQEMKIRAVLFPNHSLKKVSPPSSPTHDFSALYFQPSRFSVIKRSPSQPSVASFKCCSPPTKVYPTGARKEAVRAFCCRHESPKKLYYAAPYPNYLH